MDVTLRALNRFGLGARLGERARIADARGWLHSQVMGDPPVLDRPDGAAPDQIAGALHGRFEAALQQQIW